MADPASPDEVHAENNTAPNSGADITVPAPVFEGMPDGNGVPVPGYAFPGDLLRG